MILPDTITEWTTLLAGVILGIFALWGVFDKLKKTRQDDSNKIDDRLIKLLKEQVEALEKKVSEQQMLLAENIKKVDTLVSENQLLREVLQGRDREAEEYRKKGLRAMSQADEILTISKGNAKNIERLYQAIESHLRNIEPITS